MIKVGLADDHSIYRKGVKMALANFENIEIVWEAVNGKEVLDKVLKVQTDVILCDINMPEMDGIEILEIIRKEALTVKVVFLSSLDNAEMISRCLSLGANGFLSKNEDGEHIYKAIYDVHNFDIHFNALVNNIMITNMLVQSAQNKRAGMQVADFKETELNVLNCICNEMTIEETAAYCFIGAKNVESIKQTLKRKTGAKTTTGLVLYAIRNNLYKL
jgi:DNA-binding NarL/FixJ family response regulator